MQPSFVLFGLWELRSYAAVLCIAIALGVTLFAREGRRVGLPCAPLLGFTMGAVVSGLFGARVAAWAFGLGSGFTWPDLNLLSLKSGFVSFGGIAGAIAFAAAYSHRLGWRVGPFLDLVAPFVPAVEAVHRFGCLLNGCCFGKPTEGSLGLYLPDSTGYWTHRYPTQVILSVFCVSLFAWLWRRRSRTTFGGEQICLFLAIYATGRIGIDALRADQAVAIGWMTGSQLVATTIAATAAAVAAVIQRSSTSARTGR